MSGAVWLALTLRTAVLKGINYNVYFEFSSSKSWQEANGSGWGFGMTNEDDNKPWYPYFVNKMIGTNLNTNSRLITSTSSSDNVASLAWINGTKLNVLIISKTSSSLTFHLNGANGQINISWIDNTVSYATPYMQTSSFASTESFSMRGYTIALLQLPVA
jgi:hypothetical protein